MVDIGSEMQQMADDPALCPEARQVASLLTATTTCVTLRVDDHSPDKALPVDHEFAGLYADVTCEGALIAAKSRVAIVGLARDIGSLLPITIERIKDTVRHFAEWRAFVVENDSTDNTKDVLRQWQGSDPEHVTVQCLDNGRPRLHGFERERVVAYAEYRNGCRRMVAEQYPQADYVIVIDLDAWGGWSFHGLINGIGWHERLPQAGCLGSTSLFQHPGVSDNTPWLHYDNWAYRWIGWEWRIGPWFAFWLPPPGSPPIKVNSVFGGLAIYKTKAYLESQYSGGNGDVEHANFHRMMQQKGWQIYLNPAQRTVMHWLVDEDSSNGGRNCHD